LEAVKQKMNARAVELSEVDQMLANDDPNLRLAAMEALLASGDPLFVSRAKEAGLFSSDLRLRQAAVRQAIDAGGPFTLILDMSQADEKETFIEAWLEYDNGVWDPEARLGRYVFGVLPYDEEAKCWKFGLSKNPNKCALTISGDMVSLADWSYAAGSLSLADDGTLKGFFRNKYKKGKPVPASIDLAQ